MKKLMIMACAIAMAAIAQAGAISWSALKVNAAPGDTMAAGLQYTGYLFTGTDYTQVTQFLAGDTFNLDSFKAAAVGHKTGTATATAMNISAVSGSFASQEVTAFLVIVNADSVDNASYYQVAKVGGTGSAYITKTFGETGNQTYGFGNQANNTSWSKIESVPEPTSGLLLLLGMAGLALKRKHA